MDIFILLVWSFWIAVVFRKKGFIYETKNSIFKFLLRRVNQTSMLYIPLFFVRKTPIILDEINILILISLLIVYILYLFINWEKVNFLMVDIFFRKKENPTYIYLINFVNSIFLIVGEEIYFRFIINELFYDSTLLFLFINSILFVICHIGSNPKKYEKIDFFNQFIFSVISGILLITTGNLIYSIVMHLLYNSPYLIVLLKRIWYNEKSM